MKTPIDQAVDRFLCWKLPKGFSPDCGIKFKRESDYKHPEFGCTKFEPTGTNLFDAVQAKDMLAHVTEPLQQAHTRTVEQLVAREKHIDELNTTITAQRKVLEQSLKELTTIFDLDPSTPIVTAIQEQLK